MSAAPAGVLHRRPSQSSPVIPASPASTPSSFCLMRSSVRSASALARLTPAAPPPAPAPPASPLPSSTWQGQGERD